MYLCRRYSLNSPNGEAVLHIIIYMEQENHIDKALAFIESVQKLGNQLSAAEQHQKALPDFSVYHAVDRDRGMGNALYQRSHKVYSPVLFYNQ